MEKNLHSFWNCPIRDSVNKFITSMCGLSPQVLWNCGGRHYDFPCLGSFMPLNQYHVSNSVKFCWHHSPHLESLGPEVQEPLSNDSNHTLSTPRKNRMNRKWTWVTKCQGTLCSRTIFSLVLTPYDSTAQYPSIETCNPMGSISHSNHNKI